MATSLTNPLSPYIQVLESEITADLRSLIKPEDLRDEVRKTLTIEVVKRAQSALYEFQNSLPYGSNETIQKTEAAALRHVGYAQEVINLRRAQRVDPNYILPSPEVAD